MKSVLLSVNKNPSYILILMICSLISLTVSAQTPVPTIDLTNFKWGLKDSATNAVILKPTYDYITKYENGISFVKQGELYGVINKLGKEIAQPIYDNYSWVNDTLIKLKKDDLYALFTLEMKEVMPFVFNSIFVYGVYLVVNDGEKSGVIDLHGDIIIPFIYDDISLEYKKPSLEAPDSYGVRVTINNKMGTIDLYHNALIPMDYEGLEFKPNNHVIVLKDKKFGLMSHSGQFIIPLNKYDFLDISSDDIIAAGIDDKYGYINASEEIIIPFIYEQTMAFKYGLGAVQLDGLWGAINKLNELVIPLEHETPIQYHRGITQLEKRINGSSKFAFVNEEGEWLSDFVYDEAEIFRHPYAKVRIGERWGLINLKGEVVIPIQFDKVTVSKECIIVMNDYQQGLCDLEGNIILPMEYSFIYPPQNHHLIMVRNGIKYGYVNHSGDIIIPIIYENARSFAYGRATVLLEGESFEINAKGERL